MALPSSSGEYFFSLFPILILEETVEIEAQDGKSSNPRNVVHIQYTQYNGQCPKWYSI